MTTAKLRPAVLIAVLTALVAGLTACGSGPSQVNTAVFVDGTAISVNEIQDVVDKAVKEEPAARPLAQQHKLDLVAREAVSQLVLHRLLRKAARQENISADEGDVAKAIAQDPFKDKLPTNGSVPPDALAQQLVYRARNLHDVVADQVLQAKLADKYYAKLQVTFDYAAATQDKPGNTMKAQAEAKAREFAANPDDVASLIDKETQAGHPAGPGQQVTTVQSAALAATVLFGAREGSVVTFELQGQGQQTAWVAAVIRKRDTNAKVDTSQATQVSPTELLAIGKRMLEPYAEKSDIRVSPRYGVWDMAAMNVAPREAEKVGLVFPPGSTESQQ